MKKKPLVSVIIPTRNSAAVLESCLAAVRKQTYKEVEIIVVDRNSTDNTKEIANKYTNKVFNIGPERSAQRNYGAKKSKGKYIVFIDSDMELTPKVIAECVNNISTIETKAIIIPEKSFGKGFWAKCKALERSYYVNNDSIEAARFFDKDIFYKAGQYNPKMVSGEDWDLSDRVREISTIGRVKSFIFHNEGRIKLLKTMKKKYYYAQLARVYIKNNPQKGRLNSPSGPIKRFALFFSHPRILLTDPIHGIGMLFMKVMEYFAGAVGYVMISLSDSSNT